MPVANTRGQNSRFLKVARQSVAISCCAPFRVRSPAQTIIESCAQDRPSCSVARAGQDRVGRHSRPPRLYLSACLNRRGTCLCARPSAAWAPQCRGYRRKTHLLQNPRRARLRSGSRIMGALPLTLRKRSEDKRTRQHPATLHQRRSAGPSGRGRSQVAIAGQLIAARPDRLTGCTAPY
jgi:hypothetical protein